MHRKLVLPHKVIYTSTGRPAEYDQFSIPLFVSEYLPVMLAKKEPMRPYVMQHLQDIMADVELYGWESIRAFHAL